MNADPLERLRSALAERPAHVDIGGGYRTCDPADTYERVAPHLARMGITRVAIVTGLDIIGIPVAVAIRPNSRSLATSQGKGLSVVHARVSAVMEALELYHAECATLPLKINSERELRDSGHALIDTGALPRAPRSTLDERTELVWVEGLELLERRRVWVPYELVHTNYTLPSLRSCGAFNVSSNGLASGNHLQEALLAALCEVVERDATSLWQHGDAAHRAAALVDPSSVDDPACRELLQRFEAAGVGVALHETTSDIGLPAFHCTIVDRDDRPARPIHAASGMGCHPRRAVAAVRALSEAAQSRLTVTSGSRDDVGREDYRRLQDRRTLQAARERVLGTAPSRDFRTVPDHARERFDQDIELVLQRLRARGIAQVVAVDLTRDDIGIPVVRIVCTGLEGIAETPDYVPGARALGQLGPPA